MSGERWFSDEELAAMSQPTMDRAIAALDAGDVEQARVLCEAMRTEWRGLHDTLVELVAGLISFVQEDLGDEGVERAWRSTMERAWKEDAGKALAADRRRMVEALATAWRAHSASGVGAHGGAFTVTEDDAKLTFSMNPCGSGQKLWRKGRYEGDDAYATTDAAHGWTYGRKDFPVYCTHCTFMNELLPIEWYGQPLYPSEAPADFDHDPCVWHWYKDPTDVPAEHWTRYGLERPR